MDRCSIPVVEFLKCPNHSTPTRVQLVRKPKRLSFNLAIRLLIWGRHLKDPAARKLDKERLGRSGFPLSRFLAVRYRWHRPALLIVLCGFEFH
jgi:hypothetical protein